MSKTEIVRELYKQCRDMDIEETMDMVLGAETEEEESFFSLVSDFILQRKQKEAITKKRF